MCSEDIEDFLLFLFSIFDQFLSEYFAFWLLAEVGGSLVEVEFEHDGRGKA